MYIKCIGKVSKIRYLDIIFGNNLLWNLCIHNLRATACTLIKLKDLIPKHTMHIIYFALHQSIYRNRLLVWGGLDNDSLNTLQTNQNNIVRICLNKFTLEGSTGQNYMDLIVLLMKYLYKIMAFMLIFKRFIKGNSEKFFENKKENTVYNILVKYSFKFVVVVVVWKIFCWLFKT